LISEEIQEDQISKSCEENEKSKHIYLTIKSAIRFNPSISPRDHSKIHNGNEIGLK
jgi:hypothetical protein